MREETSQATVMTGTRRTVKETSSLRRYALESTLSSRPAREQGVKTHLGREIPAKRTWIPMTTRQISYVKLRPASGELVQDCGLNQPRQEGPTGRG